MLLDINHLNNKISGVIHIGGFIGDEFDLYQRMNIGHMIFFEPLPHTYQILQHRVQNRALTYNFALGNYNGRGVIYESKFDNTVNYITGASSSLLKPKKHLELHPSITFPNTLEVEVRRLDDVVALQNINIQNYNFINIDVQGYELEVFRGAQLTLKHIDYIIAEVNRDEVYENCAQVEELDSFLAQYNFVRKETNWAGNLWGDAFYEKLHDSI